MTRIPYCLLLAVALIACDDPIVKDPGEVGADTDTDTDTDADTDVYVPVPDAPQVVDDLATVDEGDVTVIDVLANDTDAQDDMDPSTLTIVAEPLLGEVVLRPDFTVGYRHPDADITDDVFTYTVSDLAGNTSDIGTVTISVTPRVNVPPTANDDNGFAPPGALGSLNVTNNDTDPDDAVDVASVAIVAQPAFGTLVVQPDGTVEYTHDGSLNYVDGYTYVVSDMYGDESNIATVNMIITDAIEMDLTPTTGVLIETDDPWWANKGYQFTAAQDFSISGGAWWIQLPVGGYVSLSIYDQNGILLARGTQGIGQNLGLEEWYQSDLNFNFVAGTVYTASFYTNFAASSTFDRQDGPQYGYSVAGIVNNVEHRSSSVSGDNANEEWPDYLGNTWAPHQRLDVLTGP